MGLSDADILLHHYKQYGGKRELTAKGLGITIHRVRMALSRERAQGSITPVAAPAPATNDVPAPESPPPQPPKSDKRLMYEVRADGKILINRLARTITTDLGEFGEVVFSFERHALMRRRYADEWESTRETIPEIARDFDLHPRAFNIYKTIHQWTHASDPFTDEEWSEGLTVDQAVADTMESQRRAFYRRLQQEKQRLIVEDAEKWRRHKTLVLDELVAAVAESGLSYHPPLVNIRTTERPFDVFTACFDTHYGKEGVDGYNRESAAQLLLEKTQQVVDRISLYGRPKRIICTHGGDFLHVDTYSGTTTAGTPQDRDGSPHSMLREGAMLFIRYIDILRQIPSDGVDVLPIHGNHDDMLGSAVHLFAHAWFRGAPDVRVRLDDAPRQYIESGKTLIGLSHGDGAKLKDLPLLMAREASGAWGRATFYEFYSGHLHHEVTRDFQGVRVSTLPSIAGDDRWHQAQGYTSARRSAAAFIIDLEEGVISTVYAPVINPDCTRFPYES